MSTITYADLFCGLGAFHHAFNSLNANAQCVFACDIDPHVRKLYEDNYGLKPEGDINQINIETMPSFDILCAGFPCQPFSIAGNQAGFADKEKGSLFFAILKIIDAKTPTTILLENVKNLLTINGGETFLQIVAELEKRGYIVSYKVIDSKHYNSPQSRQRLFIVGSKTTKYVFPPDPSTNVVPVSSIIDTKETRFLQYQDKYLLEEIKTKEKEKEKEKEKANKSCKMLFKLVHKTTKKGGRQGERVYSIDSCGPTICASSGGPGAKTGLYYIDKKVRRLNVVEGLRMFGFRDDYLFYLGNSVVVNVIQTLLPSLLL
jgi:DNA (cytosine-5)-methyltransferase 1